MHEDPHNGDVITDINYFPATGTPIPKSAWKPRYLDHHDSYTSPMLIRDVRRNDQTFSLDVHGFQYIQLPENKNRVSREHDEDTVKREYYPELEAIAKNL